MKTINYITHNKTFGVRLDKLSDFCYNMFKKGSFMQLDERITIRLSRSEKKKLAKKADEKGVSLSMFIRNKLLKKR